MNRDTFMERLSFMQDYTIIPVSFYTLVGSRKKHPKKYNAGTDSRFSSYMGYASVKDRSHDAFLTLVAFSIAANLSFYCLKQPSRSQLQEMLQICGYSSEQMEQYVRKNNGLEPEMVPSHRLQPVVFLLTHMLNDTLADENEWRGRTNQKSGKKAVVNPSLTRLRNLVSYMTEHELLEYLDRSSGANNMNAYENFVMRHAGFIIKRSCVINEMNLAFQLLEEHRDKMKAERDKAIIRLLSNPGKPAVMNAPLANPVSESLSLEDRRALNSVLGIGETVPESEIQIVIDRCKGTMPPETLAIIQNYEREYDDLMDGFDQILLNADTANDAIRSEQEKWMSWEYLPVVAEEAFKAILDGEDEIYKLKVGRHIWQDFMTQSNLPVPVMQFEELPDEEEWDFVSTEANGKLGLKIYDEEDLITTKTDSETGMEDVTLPLPSLLSKYAGMTVDTSLYIRKSYIRMFKDAGYSDRRARDFAVVLGVLAGIDKLESCTFTTPYEDLYDVGETETVQSETENDQRPPLTRQQISSSFVADAETKMDKINAADENNNTDAGIETLEKDLKQARKENQSYRHEISTLQRQLERLQHQLAEQNSNKQSESAEIEASEEIVPETKYPYRTKLKVVVYGGFDVFHRELKNLLPDVRIVEASSHIDVRPFRNADIVFLQINKTDHSGYYAVCDACKSSGVPYIHLNYASAKRCADVMVREMWKMGK
ncbi:MAG: hypothetical protein LUI12_13080 [Clostridiales bacterium]|nr:hypothetical protein [Clostridiales bacterium]